MRLRRIWFGALLGALGGFLVVELGFKAVLPGQLSDPAFVLITFVVGALFGAMRWPALIGVLDAALIVVYFLVAYTPLMAALAPRWVRYDVPRTRPDAVITLSSSVLSDTALDDAALDRLLTAIDVVQRDSIPRLVTTRVAFRFGGHPVSSDSDQHRMIVDLAHLAARWDVVDSVHSTHDEALRSAHLLLPAGAKTVVVVTSPMHTRRACAVFEGVGFTVYCQPAREHSHETWHPRDAADRVEAFREYVYERLGWLEYRARGWVH